MLSLGWALSLGGWATARSTRSCGVKLGTFKFPNEGSWGKGLVHLESCADGDRKGWRAGSQVILRSHSGERYALALWQRGTRCLQGELPLLLEFGGARHPGMVSASRALCMGGGSQHPLSLEGLSASGKSTQHPEVPQLQGLSASGVGVGVEGAQHPGDPFRRPPGLVPETSAPPGGAEPQSTLRRTRISPGCAGGFSAQTPSAWRSWN